MALWVGAIRGACAAMWPVACASCLGRVWHVRRGHAAAGGGGARTRKVPRQGHCMRLDLGTQPGTSTVPTLPHRQPTTCPDPQPRLSRLPQAAAARFCFTYPHHFDLTTAVPAAATGATTASPGADDASATAVVGESVLGSRCVGAFSGDELLDAAALCRRGCERVATFARLSLAKSLQAAGGA